MEAKAVFFCWLRFRFHTALVITHSWWIKAGKLNGGRGASNETISTSI